MARFTGSINARIGEKESATRRRQAARKRPAKRRLTTSVTATEGTKGYKREQRRIAHSGSGGEHNASNVRGTPISAAARRTARRADRQVRLGPREFDNRAELDRYIKRARADVAVLNQYRRDLSGRQARRHARVIDRANTRIGLLEAVRSTITDEPYHGAARYLLGKATNPIPGLRIPISPGVGPASKPVYWRPSPIDAALAPLGLGIGVGTAAAGARLGGRLALSARHPLTRGALAINNNRLRIEKARAAGVAIRKAGFAGGAKRLGQVPGNIVLSARHPLLRAGIGASRFRARGVAGNIRRAGRLGGAAIVASPFVMEVPNAWAAGDARKLTTPLTGKGAAMEAAQGTLHPSSRAGAIPQNIINDVIGLPATVIPSMSLMVQAAVQAANGDGRHLAALWQGLKQSDPFASQTEGIDPARFVRLFVQHPLYSALTASGIYAGVGRGLGAASRRGLIESFADVRSQRYARMALGGLPRDYSPNVFSARIQKRIDRRIHEGANRARDHEMWQDRAAAREAVGQEPGPAPPVPSRGDRAALTYERKVAAANRSYVLDFRHGVTNQQTMDHNAVLAGLMQELTDLLGADAPGGFAGRHALAEENAPLAVFAIEGTMRRDSAVADLHTLREAYNEAIRPDANGVPGLRGEEAANNRARVRAIENALADPDLRSRAFDAADRFISVQRPQEEANVLRGIIDGERALRARQVPGAVLHEGYRYLPVVREGEPQGYSAFQRQPGDEEYVQDVPEPPPPTPDDVPGDVPDDPYTDAFDEADIPDSPFDEEGGRGEVRMGSLDDVDSDSKYLVSEDGGIYIWHDPEHTTLHVRMEDELRGGQEDAPEMIAEGTFNDEGAVDDIYPRHAQTSGNPEAFGRAIEDLESAGARIDRESAAKFLNDGEWKDVLLQRTAEEPDPSTLSFNDRIALMAKKRAEKVAAETGPTGPLPEAPPVVTWEHGQPGRGLVTDDGEVHIWNDGRAVEGVEPTSPPLPHGPYVQQNGLTGKDVASFAVTPDGRVFGMAFHGREDRVGDIVDAIRRTDPTLRFDGTAVSSGRGTATIMEGSGDDLVRQDLIRRGEDPDAPPERDLELMPTRQTNTGFISQRPREATGMEASGMHRQAATARVETPSVARTGEAVLKGTSPADLERIATSAAAPGLRNIRDAEKRDFIANPENVYHAGPDLAQATTRQAAENLLHSDEVARWLDGEQGVIVRLDGERAAQDKIMQEAADGEGINLADWTDMEDDWFMTAQNLDGPATRYGIARRSSVQRMQEHSASVGPVARQATNIVTAFKRSVLPWSPSWYLGNWTDTSLRALVDGRLPVGLDRASGNYRLGERAEAASRNREGYILGDPTLFEGLAPGGFAGTVASSGGAGVTRGNARATVSLRRILRRNREKAENVNTLFTRARNHPTSTNVGQAVGAAQQFLVDLNTEFLERSALRSKVGQEVRRDLRQVNRDMGKATDLTPAAIQDWVRGKLDTPAQAALAKRVQSAHGNWTSLSPMWREGLLSYAPFGLWLRAALRFVYQTLPRDHPILTAILAQSARATEFERRILGMDPQMSSDSKKRLGRLPDYMQGNIVLPGGALMPVRNITSFGILADGWTGAGKFLVPQFTDAINAAQGVDWKGDRLTDDQNRRLNGNQRALALLSGSAETFIPALSLSHRIFRGATGKSILPHSTFVEQDSLPHVLLHAFLPPSKTVSRAKQARGKWRENFSQPIDVPLKGGPANPATKRKKRVSGGGSFGGFGGGSGGGGGHGF